MSDYGRLSSELFRAVRLVVDTGIHDKGWTRDQVVAYMRENDVDDAVAQTETDRYIAWPGQALAYKIGQLKIRELRERAKTQLGPRFDIKAFHDEILNGGALPLDLLEARVDGWIKTQLPAESGCRAIGEWLWPNSGSFKAVLFSLRRGGACPLPRPERAKFE